MKLPPRILSCRSYKATFILILQRTRDIFVFDWDFSVCYIGKPCHRASQVVGEYRSIVAGLRHVVKNYKKGKIAFNEERKAISADLEDSFKELSHLGRYFRHCYFKNKVIKEIIQSFLKRRAY